MVVHVIRWCRIEGVDCMREHVRPFALKPGGKIADNPVHDAACCRRTLMIGQRAGAVGDRACSALSVRVIGKCLSFSPWWSVH
jgi:hypothetical protein